MLLLSSSVNMFLTISCDGGFELLSFNDDCGPSKDDDADAARSRCRWFASRMPYVIVAVFASGNDDVGD